MLATRDFHVSALSPHGVRIFDGYISLGSLYLFCTTTSPVLFFRSWQNILSRLAAMSNMPEWKFDLPRPSCQAYLIICLGCQNVDSGFLPAHRAPEDTSLRWKGLSSLLYNRNLKEVAKTLLPRKNTRLLVWSLQWLMCPPTASWASEASLSSMRSHLFALCNFGCTEQSS